MLILQFTLLSWYHFDSVKNNQVSRWNIIKKFGSIIWLTFTCNVMKCGLNILKSFLETVSCRKALAARLFEALNFQHMNHTRKNASSCSMSYGTYNVQQECRKRMRHAWAHNTMLLKFTQITNSKQHQFDTKPQLMYSM